MFHLRAGNLEELVPKYVDSLLGLPMNEKPFKGDYTWGVGGRGGWGVLYIVIETSILQVAASQQSWHGKLLLKKYKI